jgi:hypothetical protein
MKTFIVTAAVLALFISVISCSKDKFQTKPRIEFKDYDKVIDPGGTLTVRFNYFDKEGDLNRGSILAMKVRLNQFPPIAPGDFKADTFTYPLPDFPPKNNGEITFQIDYAELDESSTKSDTIRFKFAVTDRAGNTSDIITSDPIVARMP